MNGITITDCSFMDTDEFLYWLQLDIIEKQIERDMIEKQNKKYKKYRK